VVESLLSKLVSSPLPDQLVEQIEALSAQLRSSPDVAGRAVAWLIDKKDDEFVPAHPGPLRYLGWTALVRYLRPVVGAFAGWRNEEGWLRRYCPMCGAPPGMAQLVGTDPGRLRLLSCGYCSTRWRYRRTGCPFCEHDDDHRLSVVAVEGEAGLRIDYCEACSGYVKTYAGQGNETFLLADWTSLHLDILARDRGLKRLAGSLYEL
jgi:FdhE protein